jgi:hypothetical protein
MNVSGELRATADLPSGKKHLVPLDRKLGGPQSHSGRGGEEKHSQPPSAIETKNPDRPAHILVAIPTELCSSQILEVWDANLKKFYYID